MTDICIKLNQKERSTIICALQMYSDYLGKKEMFTRSDEVDALRFVILDADDVCIYNE